MAQTILRTGADDVQTLKVLKNQVSHKYRGMRITVQDVFEYLAGGMAEDQILSDFPELTREDINACFAFAADRERKLFVAPA